MKSTLFENKRNLWIGAGVLAIIVIVVVIVVVARGTSSGSATPTVAEAAAVYTSAAQTAEAKLTELAAVTSSPTPTNTPATPTNTSVPTAAFLTPTVTTAVTQAPSGQDRVEFVADVTVPDGTNFRVGESFTKVWRLKNVGTTTWTNQYALIFVSGAQMSGQSPKALPGNVPPGQTVDVSIDLVAPNSTGSQVGYWMLRNANGQNFGVGPNYNAAFYVEINVVGGATGTVTVTSTSTTGTAVASASPTTAGPTVSDVSMTVDVANVVGTCPHTFNYTAQFKLNKAATVTYRLEAETGFPITLPDPTTVSLNAGTQTVTYALQFSDAVTGVARFHVTAPEDVQSGPVNFSLTCQ